MDRSTLAKIRQKKIREGKMPVCSLSLYTSASYSIFYNCSDSAEKKKKKKRNPSIYSILSIFPLDSSAQLSYEVHLFKIVLLN